MCCTFEAHNMSKFWRILKKVLILLSALSAAAVFVVVLTSAVKKEQALVCKNLIVHIDYSTGISFLKDAEIADRLNYLSGENLVGRKIATIDLTTLERELEANPFIEQAAVYVDQKQNLIVDIIQKRPILRILNNDGVSYYLGEKGEHIPLCNNFTAHVIIATGLVETHQNLERDSTVQAALFQLTQFIQRDNFLSALIDQIVVQPNGEVTLIPKISGHVILFGVGNDHVEDKFSRLKIFYNEGLRKTGWNRYKTIDLRFDEQVVCEKKDTTTNTL